MGNIQWINIYYDFFSRLNFLVMIINIIVHNIIEDSAKDIQKPNRLNLKYNPNMHPSGNAIIQYEIIFDIITILVFFKPLKIPDSDTCSPSKIWKKHKI